MARAPNEKIQQAYELYKTGLKLIDIASELDTPVGTIRSWKNRNGWMCNATSKDDCNVAKGKVKKNKAIDKDVEQVLDNTELTDKQRLFCLYYIRCFNATKAYQKAYECDYNTAAAISYRVLAYDGVREEIQRLKQNKLNRLMLDEYDIFQKYMDIAFSDMTDYAKFGNKEMVVKNEVTGEDETLTYSFVDLNSSDTVDGTIISEVSKGKDGSKVKLLDKMKALQWLSDHMNLATEKQRAEIAILKSKTNLDDEGVTEDDGFINALTGKVDEIWLEE